MLKKAVPLAILLGILLVGCGAKNALPKNNETPMQDVREDARQWKNDVERDIDGRNFDNGTNGTIDNGLNDNNNTQVEIIEDLNRKNNVH